MAYRRSAISGEVSAKVPVALPLEQRTVQESSFIITSTGAIVSGQQIEKASAPGEAARLADPRMRY